MHSAEHLPATITDAVKESMAALGGVRKSIEVIEWIENQIPQTFDAKAIQSQLRRCSVNNPGAISRHPGAPGFLFKVSTGLFELYDSSKHGLWDEKGFPIGANSAGGTSAEDLDELADDLQDQLAATREFAYELHLREYLARNLGALEPGLLGWTGVPKTSMEYQVCGRRVDILARDKQGIPVVIELKVSKGHEQTIGQALYYRGKLKSILGVSRVRIIIVAGRITDELRVACSEVQDVEVFSYLLSMQLQKEDLTGIS